MRPTTSRTMTPPNAEPQGPAADGSGILLVDKPSGWTSHQVVGRLRRLLGTRKVGHAGTLDPMATGLLIIGVNRATRLLGALSDSGKCYSATIRLGQGSSTDDAEGELEAPVDTSAITPQQIQTGIAALTGPIMQVPSTVSAIKVDGQRAHARVRAGEQFTLAARPVTIEQFELLGSQPVPVEGRQLLDLQVRVACSSGTYIRALARDLGADLGVGGHLTELRRTSIGGFEVPDGDAATDLEAGVLGPTLSMGQVARRCFVVTEVDRDQARRVVHGQRVVHTSDPGLLGRLNADQTVAVLCEDDLVAMARVRPANNPSEPAAGDGPAELQASTSTAVVLHPSTVLAHDQFA